MAGTGLVPPGYGTAKPLAALRLRHDAADLRGSYNLRLPGVDPAVE